MHLLPRLHPEHVLQLEPRWSCSHRSLALQQNWAAHIATATPVNIQVCAGSSMTPNPTGQSFTITVQIVHTLHFTLNHREPSPPHNLPKASSEGLLPDSLTIG